MKKLLVLVGLPRSGKSYYTQNQEAPIVNKDSIRLALHGKRFMSEAEEWINIVAKTMIKSLFYTGYETVILDDCNVTKKRREYWLSDKWKTEFIEITTTKEKCIERANLENDNVIIPVIERMANEYEPIDLD